MFCPNCGSQNDDNARFCATCSKPFVENSQPVQPMQPAVVPGKGMGIAAMILGIVSLVLFCFWYLAIPCGIVGLILGILSLNKAKAVGMKNGLATAGIITSAIAIGIAVIIVLLAAIGITAATAYL